MKINIKFGKDLRGHTATVSSLCVGSLREIFTTLSLASGLGMMVLI